MNIIGMTFLKRLFSIIFCNSMKSLKLIKTFMGGCIVMFFYIHLKFVKDIFSMYLMLSFTIPSLRYNFFIIMIFIPL
jgi:hypothetical protein